LAKSTSGGVWAQEEHGSVGGNCEKVKIWVPLWRGEVEQATGRDRQAEGKRAKDGQGHQGGLREREKGCKIKEKEREREGKRETVKEKERERERGREWL
jgi:hypothetical protein